MQPTMSTPTTRLEPLHEWQLDEVLRIEQSAYAFAWTRGNFSDSLRSGYTLRGLYRDDALLGYWVAMPGVDEAHLLNLTVAPAYQRQGWAGVLLNGLAEWARALGAHHLWLEVRVSNARAMAIYERFGFVHAGRRKAYYPGPQGRREDALVMSLAL